MGNSIMRNEIDKTTEIIIADFQACLLQANAILAAGETVSVSVMGDKELKVRNPQENNDLSVMVSALLWYLRSHHHIMPDDSLPHHIRELAIVAYGIGRWSTPEQARKEQSHA